MNKKTILYQKILTAQLKLGQRVGWTLTPLTFLGSFLRKTRLFHAEGAVFTVEITPVINQKLLGPQALAQKLSGTAMLRFSTATWRNNKEWSDILGCSIKLYRKNRKNQKSNSISSDTEQDLLFITAQSLFSLPFAFINTNAHHYLANNYYTITPFDLPHIGPSKIRIVPSSHILHVKEKTSMTPQKKYKESRIVEIEKLIKANKAKLQLEYIPYLDKDNKQWRPLVSIQLIKKLEIDQEKLRFSPFHTGLGIKPLGFINGLRKPTYIGSQLGRLLQNFPIVNKKKAS